MEADEVIKAAIVADFFEAEVGVSELSAGVADSKLGDKLYGRFSGFLFEVSAERIFGQAGNGG